MCGIEYKSNREGFLSRSLEIRVVGRFVQTFCSEELLGLTSGSGSVLRALGTECCLSRERWREASGARGDERGLLGREGGWWWGGVSRGVDLPVVSSPPPSSGPSSLCSLPSS